MDVPPFNIQAPMMMPMMQRLFNIPSTFIQMQHFAMIDKDGKPVHGKPQARHLTQKARIRIILLAIGILRKVSTTSI